MLSVWRSPSLPSTRKTGGAPKNEMMLKDRGPSRRDQHEWFRKKIVNFELPVLPLSFQTSQFFPRLCAGFQLQIQLNIHIIYYAIHWTSLVGVCIVVPKSCVQIVCENFNLEIFLAVQLWQHRRSHSDPCTNIRCLISFFACRLHLSTNTAEFNFIFFIAV